MLSTAAIAEDTLITGIVQPKCSIFTDHQGIYGSPSPSVLSTAAADGGVLPVVRYDVVLADYYKAVITTPTSFSQSPGLADTVAWTGSAAVHEVSDAGMSAYDTNKIEYNATTEFDLTIAGSTWFEMESKAEYGGDKPFPGGNYTAMVEANCIAK